MSGLGEKRREGSEREAAAATAAAAARGARAHARGLCLCASARLCRWRARCLREKGKGAEARVCGRGEAAARPLGAPRVFGSVNGGRDSMCVAAAAFASVFCLYFCCVLSCAFDYPPSPPPPLLPPPLRAAKAHATVGCASCERKRPQTHENAEEKLTSIKSSKGVVVGCFMVVRR